MIAFSSGQGRFAVWSALGSIAFVLAERGLHWSYFSSDIVRRKRAYLRLVWRLYHRPFLLAGWLISLGAIFLALYRNLVLLGGGRIQFRSCRLGPVLCCGKREGCANGPCQSRGGRMRMMGGWGRAAWGESALSACPGLEDSGMDRLR